LYRRVCVSTQQSELSCSMNSDLPLIQELSKYQLLLIDIFKFKLLCFKLQSMI
jgi:hypothetical protein